MFDLDINFSTEGANDPKAVQNVIVDGIWEFHAQFLNITDEKLGELVENTWNDILNNFPIGSGNDEGHNTISDIQFKRVGKFDYEIFTFNPVVFYIEYGTAGHGPVTAPFLVFETTDGTIVYTKWVRGIPAHYVILKALNRFSAQLEAM